MKHLRQPIPYVRDFNQQIPQSVENIILKATAKNPEQRYKTAELMLEDLRHCMDWNKKNEDRLIFETPNITKVDVSDGHVQVEYSDQPIQESKKKLSKKSIGIILLSICVVCALVLLISIATGLIHLNGFMGYETFPNVEKMDYKEAKTLLKDNNFTQITIKKVLSDSYDAGDVISANYNDGDIVQSSKEIVLTVSKGAGYLVKDYTGMSIEEVEAEFEKNNLSIEIVKKYKDAANTNPNLILKQKGLKAGKRIDPDKRTKLPLF